LIESKANAKETWQIKIADDFLPSAIFIFNGQ